MSMTSGAPTSMRGQARVRQPGPRPARGRQHGPHRSRPAPLTRPGRGGRSPATLSGPRRPARRRRVRRAAARSRPDSPRPALARPTRSSTTFAGSCTAVGRRHRVCALDNDRSTPDRPNRLSVNNSPPACDTIFDPRVRGRTRIEPTTLAHLEGAPDLARIRASTTRIPDAQEHLSAVQHALRRHHPRKPRVRTSKRRQGTSYRELKGGDDLYST